MNSVPPDAAAIAATLSPSTLSPSKRWGWRMLGLGACITALGLCVSLPLMTAGAVLGTLGLMLARPRVDRLQLGLILALALWLGVSQWWAGSSSWAWGTAYSALTLLVVRVAASSPQWRRWLLICLALSLCASAALALVQFTWGYDRSQRPWGLGTWNEAPRLSRVSGFFSMHLTFGYAVASALLLTLLSARTLGVPRWLWWSCRVLGALALLGSQARSAILGFVGAVGVRLASMGSRLGGIAAVALLLLLAMGFLWVVNPSLAQQSTGSDNPRWTIWRLGAQIGGENWWWGSGGREQFAARYRQLLREQLPQRALLWDPENPEPLYELWPELETHAPLQNAYGYWQQSTRPEQKQRFAEAMQHHFGIVSGNAAFFPEGAPHPHNSILGLLALHGLPTLLLWLGLLLSAAVPAWRNRQRHPEAASLIAGAIVLALVAGCFEDYANDSEAGFALWLVIALALGLMDSQRPGEPQPAVTGAHPAKTPEPAPGATRT